MFLTWTLGSATMTSLPVAMYEPAEDMLTLSSLRQDSTIGPSRSTAHSNLTPSSRSDPQF